MSATGFCSNRNGCKVSLFCFKSELLLQFLPINQRIIQPNPPDYNPLIDILGEFSPRTVAGIDLTTVLGIVLAFILFDIFATALLVIFSAGAGKRSSSQTGFFNWGLPDLSGFYSSVSQMYNR